MHNIWILFIYEKQFHEALNFIWLETSFSIVVVEEFNIIVVK